MHLHETYTVNILTPADEIGVLYFLDAIVPKIDAFNVGRLLAISRSAVPFVGFARLKRERLLGIG